MKIYTQYTEKIIFKNVKSKKYKMQNNKKKTLNPT